MLLTVAPPARADETVRFTTEDGIEIVADFAKPTAAEKPYPVVILLHMYHSDRGTYRPLTAQLVKAGYATLAIDMRGHGDSGGDQRDALRKRMNDRDPTLFRNMYKDAQAAYAFLTTREDIDVSRLAMIGASVGCSVALDYAARDPSVDVVVCMTPGIRYLGLDSTGPVRKIHGLSVLLLAGQDERKATDELASLNKDVSKEVVPQERVHGTHMFGQVPDIEKTIVEFITRNIGPKTDQTTHVYAEFGHDRYYKTRDDLHRLTKAKPQNVRVFSSKKEAEKRGLRPAE